MGKIKPITDQNSEKKNHTFHNKFVDSSDESDYGPVSKTLKNYGEATSIHGIPYLLEGGRNPIERLFWLVVIGIGIWIALYFSLEIYDDWQSNQVVTTVSTTGYDIANIEYPLITICAQGSVKEITGENVTFHNFNGVNHSKAKTNNLD